MLEQAKEDTEHKYVIANHQSKLLQNENLKLEKKVSELQENLLLEMKAQKKLNKDWKNLKSELNEAKSVIDIHKRREQELHSILDDSVSFSELDTTSSSTSCVCCD